MSWALIIPGNIVEILIIYHYWFSLLERRFSKKKSVIIFFIVQLLNAARSWLMFEMVTAKAVITLVVMLVLMHALFKDKIYKKILVHTVYMVCVMLAESLGMVFAKYIYHHDMLSITDPTMPNFLWQGTSYLFIFIFNIIALLLIKKEKIDPNSRVTQYVCLYASVQCLMAFIFTMLIFEYKITSTLMILLLFFVLIASFVIGILLYITTRYATAAAIEAEYIKNEAVIKDKQFKALREQYSEYKKLRHDFSNHLKIIKELNNPDKLIEYTRSLQDSLDRLEQITYCDNATLDALLCIKKTEAQQQGVGVSYFICDLQKTQVSDFDLCTVVSNLLDNAIEAAEKTDKKYVSLQITKKLDRLVITVRNSSATVNKDLKTTKPDAENHGIGIKNIRSTAAKYDGDYACIYENKEFIAIVNMRF